MGRFRAASLDCPLSGDRDDAPKSILFKNFKGRVVFRTPAIGIVVVLLSAGRVAAGTPSFLFDGGNGVRVELYDPDGPVLHYLILIDRDRAARLKAEFEAAESGNAAVRVLKGVLDDALDVSERTAIAARDGKTRAAARAVRSNLSAELSRFGCVPGASDDVRRRVCGNVGPNGTLMHVTPPYFVYGDAMRIVDAVVVGGALGAARGGRGGEGCGRRGRPGGRSVGRPGGGRSRGRPVQRPAHLPGDAARVSRRASGRPPCTPPPHRASLRMSV